MKIVRVGTTVGRLGVQMIRWMLVSVDVTGVIAICLIIHVHKRAIFDQFERATRSVLKNTIIEIDQQISSLSFSGALFFPVFLFSYCFGTDPSRGCCSFCFSACEHGCVRVRVYRH